MFKTPRFWYKIKYYDYPFVIILSVFSILYYTLYLSVKACKKYLGKQVKLQSKTICVGNVVMGGSGKTPVCIALAKLAIKQGLKPCFLTKGYGRSKKGFFNLTPQSNPYEYGDEPVLLSNYAPTFVYSSIKDLQVFNSKGFDVVIMDDGLHGMKVKCETTILTWDGMLDYKNKLLFPAGPFRVLSLNIKHDANIISLPKDNLVINPEFFNKMQNKFMAQTSIAIPKSIFEKKVIAFCGLARPQKFYSSLEQKGIELTKTINFADHYRYSIDDVQKLETLTEQNTVITTYKDFVKIKYILPNTKIIPIELECNIDETLPFNFLSD